MPKKSKGDAATPLSDASQPASHVMTEEISAYEEELDELIAEMEKGIDGLRRLNGAAKMDRITELNGRMQRARNALQGFRVEMRELPREEAMAYDAKAKAFHNSLNKLHGDLQWAKTEGERGGLGLRSVDDMTAGEIIQEAAKTQDQSLASVQRMKQQIADSKQVGAETAQKLKGQTEQLKNIDADIMKVKSNLKRADLLLRAFMRRMMTDKVIMIFVCLIFCGIVGIIVFKVVNPEAADESGLNVPDAVVDPLGGADVRRALRERGGAGGGSGRTLLFR